MQPYHHCHLAFVGPMPVRLGGVALRVACAAVSGHVVWLPVTWSCTTFPNWAVCCSAGAISHSVIIQPQRNHVAVSVAAIDNFKRFRAHIWRGACLMRGGGGVTRLGGNAWLDLAGFHTLADIPAHLISESRERRPQSLACHVLS